MLDAEKFLPCFMDVVQALAAVLFSYHKVCEYLNSIAPDAGTALPTAAATVDSAFELTPAVVSMMREAKAIFASFRRSVWERVQQRITSLLACAGASRLSNTQVRPTVLLSGDIVSFDSRVYFFDAEFSQCFVFLCFFRTPPSS